MYISAPAHHARVVVVPVVIAHGPEVAVPVQYSTIQYNTVQYSTVQYRRMSDGLLDDS